MAVMEALLKIKADVTGEGQIAALGRSLGGLQSTAAKATGGLKGMLASAGGLSGALGALAPAVSAVGLGAMAKGAIDAADDMNDLSQKTGVSVEQLSRFQQAANASGTSIEGVGNAMLKLNRNLASGNTGAAEALKSLGLSATDASGKLKGTDQVMLEVADKFKAMPDGAQKTALAMQLFGKSGADMIPLLNGGRAAVEELQATMTGKFAKGADELNDKLATLQGKLLQLGVSIGTALMPALNVMADAVVAIADGFAKLPGPIQNLIVLAAGIAIAWGPITGVISGVVTAFGAIAPLVSTVIIPALSGLLAWIGGTLIPGLLAFFSGPVGWTVLAVAAVVAMCVAFREPIGQFLSWVGGVFTEAFNGLKQIAYTLWVKPFVDLWGLIREPVQRFGQWIGDTFRSIWPGIVNGAKAALRGVLQWMANGINNMAGLINRLIGAFNRLPGPDIPFIPTLTVPAFAQGGYVGGPTLAMVGEGGQGEYIIPANRMAAASANYLSGARGNGVLSGTTSAPQINITTGPVLQQDGQRYITVEDFERGARQITEGIIGRLRTPAARIALGMS